MKKVHISETILRDAQQSQVATRMPFSAFEEVLDKFDDAGYYSVECWGGATFDSCLRFLNEDPWERLRKIKAKIKTPLQMLLRGQNILGYKHYPDEVVRKFIEKAVGNGMDIIRIFDALNDTRNIEVCIEETLKQGAHAQGVICYTTSPVHTIALFTELGKTLEGMGVNSICVKDMAGVMGPQEAYDMITSLKANVKVPVFLHTHDTTGLGRLTYLKAVEAGVDGIDCALSALGGGTSQPPTEAMNYALTQLGYDTGVNGNVIKGINDHFKPIRDQFLKDGTLDPHVLMTDTDGLVYQVPGGMLSNLMSQLKAQGALDRLDEVLAETPRVRADLGYPPLVTPLSQMVGVQASMNVLFGERYKTIGKEIQGYIKGEYGRAPAPVNEELVKRVCGDEKPATERLSASFEPIFDKTKKELSGKADNDEDVLSYLLFPQVAEEFFDKREKRRNKKDPVKFDYTIESSEA